MVSAEGLTPSERVWALIDAAGGVIEASRRTGISVGSLYRSARIGEVRSTAHAVALILASGGSVGLVGALVRLDADGRVPRRGGRP